MADPVWVDGVTPQNAVNMNKLQTRDEKGQPSGYSSLDGTGKVPLAQLPPVGADLVYDGDYPATSPYTDGDIVVYNGIAYLCVVPTSAAPVPWPGGPVPVPPYPTPAYGTSLPASPTDGQQAILVDSITAPTWSWLFRYNAGSTNANKWEFLGGPPIESGPQGSCTCTTASTWVDASGGPAITVPRSGVYKLYAEFSASLSVTGITDIYGRVVFSTSGNFQMDNQDWSSQYQTHHVAQQMGQAALVAGETSKMQAMVGQSNSCNFRYFCTRIIPVRVS